MGKLKLAILSDLHIAEEGELPYGVDTRSQFLTALELAVKDRPDMLIIGGDLCFREGDREVYEWVKKQLEKSGLPFRVISGNHDHSGLLTEVFHPEKSKPSNELYYSEKINGNNLIFCDSSPGELSAGQWEWLAGEIEKTEECACIFIHHPPVNCGVPYMDNRHAFRQMEKMEKLISRTAKNIFFFCGHYHCEKTILRDSAKVFITPSTFFNLDDRSDDFVILNKIPAFRRLILHGNSLETAVFQPGGV